MRSWQIGLMALALLLNGGCKPDQTQTTPTAATVASPTAPARTANPTPGFDNAISSFKAANSYGLKIQATHVWSLNGQKQQWEFAGEGSYSKPDRFRSRIEGTADSYFEIDISGNKITAKDTRGGVANADTTFGGPGVGASPYTVMQYMVNAGKVTAGDSVVLAGVKAYHYTFEPKREAMAALDSAHAADIPKVTAVKGEVWISDKDGRPLREKATVDFTGHSGSPETVVMILDFFDYDK